MFAIQTEDDDDVENIIQARLKGETYIPKQIKSVPSQFQKWIENNKDRIDKANARGTLPYWIKDNPKFVNIKEAEAIKKQLFNMYKKFKNSGNIEIIDGYKKKADHSDLISISRFFAQKGDSVKITTDIHFKDEKYKEVFGDLIGTKYERKCPDLIINGKFYEYESFIPPFSKIKIKNMLSKGLQQSENIIINNTNGASDRYILKLVNDRIIRQGQDINEVWLYEKGKIRSLYKKTAGK